jgi:hypothetical protein
LEEDVRAQGSFIIARFVNAWFAIELIDLASTSSWSESTRRDLNIDRAGAMSANRPTVYAPH